MNEGFFGLKKKKNTGFLLSTSLTTQTNSVLLGWQHIIPSLTEVTAIQAKEQRPAGALQDENSLSPSFQVYDWDSQRQKANCH